MSTQKTTLEFGKRRFPATNLDKVLFPKDGITKGEIIAYYDFIAPWMLTHVKGRALSLQRYPDGIDAFSFFQRNIGEHFPDWIGRATLKMSDGNLTSVVCDNNACLAYLGSQAAFVIHSHLSLAKSPHTPVEIIWDLDPSGDDFELVRGTAFELRDLLMELGLVPFVKTTGSRGLHVVVPVKGVKDFDDSRDFAARVAALMVARHPDKLTVEHRKAKRGGRLYFDVARNGYTQTAVAPYSIRALAKAPIATPITWDELKSRKLTSQSFNIGNIRARMKAAGDPWADIRKHAKSLNAALKKLS
ncbi:MAG: non-homologous end-joining DNA ligase [Planctomycetes bacterium]|nr:non-homologous end-joining DNA ligase [Planctomycetota bacterium]